MSAEAESVPIACSLNAVGAAQRRRQWRLLLSRALISRARIVGGVRVELRHFPGVREDVERLVAAERVCCPFLEMTTQATNAAVMLTVTAPAAAGAILDELFAEHDGGLSRRALRVPPRVPVSRSSSPMGARES